MKLLNELNITENNKFTLECQILKKVDLHKKQENRQKEKKLKKKKNFSAPLVFTSGFILLCVETNMRTTLYSTLFSREIPEKGLFPANSLNRLFPGQSIGNK